MSNTNGSAFVIFQDGTENPANPALRKTKGGEMQGKAPATKRAALGTITNQTRVQPFRAAKLGAGTLDPGFAFTNGENGQAKKSAFTTLQRAPFGIHVDNTNSQIESDIQMVSTERATVHMPTELTTLRPVLTTLSSYDEPILIGDSSPMAESPMCMDASMNNQSVECVGDTEEDRLEQIITVPEYAEDIYRYLREAELRHRPKPGYMRKQPDITPSMRSILVDWLVEVAEEYKLLRETMCLAVNYIDRFLSQMSVLRGKLQLVGAACIFLAAKFEEIYPPDVGEFVYITDDTYTKKQILRMEHLILKVLSFDVAVPTANCFCEKFLKAMDADEKTQALAMYLVELSMVEADPYLKHLPSTIAASAVCLANHTLGKEPWPQKLAEVSQFTVDDLDECLRDLFMTFTNAPNHPQQAIREKYKQSKFHEVALLCPPPIVPAPIH